MGRQSTLNHTAYLGLGANLGDRLRSMCRAAAQIGRMRETCVNAVSCLYETSPVGGPVGQPDYLNAVLKIETRRSPQDLLAGCAEIESALGRRRPVPNGPRTIDLDILLYDDRVLFAGDLIIPHPRLHTRRFVLQPLVDINPRLLHPGLNTPVGELLDHLRDSDRAAVRRVADAGWIDMAGSTGPGPSEP